jgi:hypothetical protein
MMDQQLYTVWRCVDGVNIVYVARPSEPTDFSNQTLKQQIVDRIPATSADRALFILVPPQKREPSFVRYH